MPSDEQDVLDAARDAGFFRAADYWKAEHLAGNAEIERLRAEVLRLTAENKVVAKAAYERAAQRCDDGADNLEACPPNVRTDAAIDALRFTALEIRAIGERDE